MTDIVVRVPPHDEEAEAALLGSILLDPSRMAVVTPIVSCDDFYLSKNRLLYEACLALWSKGTPPDPVTLLTELRSRDTLREIGGRERLAELAAAVPSALMADHYAKIVREKAAKRDLIRSAFEIQSAAYNGEASEDTTASALAVLSRIRDDYADRVCSDLFRVLKESDVKTPGVDWLVRGYLARGSVTLISALPKMGKSTFAYAMAAALARGDPSFVGLAIPGPCKTLVLSEEDDDVLLETWKAVGLDRESVLALTRRSAFPRRPLSVDVDLALKAAAGHGGIGLVIVDTWRFWANLPPKGENDAGAVSQAFQQIARLAAAGYAVLLIHHTRKAGGEDGVAAAGSNALTGSADVLLELRRFGKDPTGAIRAVTATGRHQRIPPEKVVEWKDGLYSDLGDAGEARDRSVDDRVLAALVEAGKWLTAEEVIAVLEIKAPAVRASLKRLAAKHLIQVLGKGAKNSPRLHASLDVPLHDQPTPPPTT